MSRTIDPSTPFARLTDDVARIIATIPDDLESTDNFEAKRSLVRRAIHRANRVGLRARRLARARQATQLFGAVVVGLAYATLLGGLSGCASDRMGGAGGMTTTATLSTEVHETTAYRSGPGVGAGETDGMDASIKATVTWVWPASKAAHEVATTKASETK